MNKRIPVAVAAALVAVVVGATVAGCNKSGSSGSHASGSSTSAGSSSASSSSSISGPSSTAAGKPEKSPDGSFSLVLPQSLEVMPNDSKDENPGIFAMGKADDGMFIAGVIKGDDRGATPRDSLEKAGKSFSEEWKGTFDSADIKPATVDGEPAYQSSVSFPGTPDRPGDRHGQIVCVQHGDNQYGVFYAAASDSVDAEFEAIIRSWKWTA
jgi:hypothetical protein